MTPFGSRPFARLWLLAALVLLRTDVATGDPAHPLGRAADNRIYAQALVNDVMATHSELVVIGMHARAPGRDESTMIASNLDRIGKLDGPDDLAVAREHKTMLMPNLKEPDKFEVALPLLDAGGNVIGSLSTIFRYRRGDDELAMLGTALVIRNDLAGKIPTLGALFETKDGAVRTAWLQPAESIEVRDSRGKFDFLRIDDRRRRLLAARADAGTADVFDLATHRLLARLKLGGVVDTAFDPESNRYFFSVHDGERIVIVDAASLREVGSVRTEGHTAAILFETRNGKLYVAQDQGRRLWVVDPHVVGVVASIALPGWPKAMVYDPSTDRIYLNIKTADEVAVIDPNTNTVIAHWSTAPAQAPHGLALDARSGRIFSAGENGQLVALDTRSGKLMGTSAIVERVDQIAFDPVSRHVYCAGADWMSVVRSDPEGLTSVGRVKTAPTARNVAVDPTTQTVWTTYTDGPNAYARSWKLRSRGIAAP